MNGQATVYRDTEPYFALLKTAQLRLTLPRQQLVQVILSFDTPFTADSLWRAVQEQHSTVHRATMYRDLPLFVQAGVLNELVFQGAAAHYYELATAEHHHHFWCDSCQGITDIFPHAVEMALRQYEQYLHAQGFQLRQHHLKWYGLCASCASRETPIPEVSVDRQ